MEDTADTLPDCLVLHKTSTHPPSIWTHQPTKLTPLHQGNHFPSSCSHINLWTELSVQSDMNYILSYFPFKFYPLFCNEPTYSHSFNCPRYTDNSIYLCLHIYTYISEIYFGYFNLEAPQLLLIQWSQSTAFHL